MKFILLNELLNTASFAAASLFFTNNVSTPLTVGESGLLWVTFSPVGATTLEYKVDDGTQSTPSMSVYFQESTARNIVAAGQLNYFIPIANKNTFNFTMSAGTSINILSIYLVQ